jgi:hypothetical protein
MIKLAPNRTYFDTPFSPITTNNLKLSALDYDNFKHTFVSGTPTFLQGKEEQLPVYLMNTY